MEDNTSLPNSSPGGADRRIKGDEGRTALDNYETAATTGRHLFIYTQACCALLSKFQATVSPTVVSKMAS